MTLPAPKYLIDVIEWTESAAMNGLTAIAAAVQAQQPPEYAPSGDLIRIPLSGKGGSKDAWIIAAWGGSANFAAFAIGGTALAKGVIRGNTLPSERFQQVLGSHVDLRANPIKLTLGGDLFVMADNANNAEQTTVFIMIAWKEVPPANVAFYRDMARGMKGLVAIDSILTGTLVANTWSGGNSLIDSLDDISEVFLDTESDYALIRLEPFTGLATVHGFRARPRTDPATTWFPAMPAAGLEGSGFRVFNDGYLLNPIFFSGDSQATLQGWGSVTTSTRVRATLIDMGVNGGLFGGG